jgi:hypothetical protein
MGSTTVDPTTSGEDGYITEDPSLAAGKKYLALHVPNFSHNLHSYLCLGAATQWFDDAVPGTTGDPSKHGQTLANMVLGFCDDDRSPGARLSDGGANPAPAPAETVDDVGGTPTSTNTTPVGPFPASQLMENESAILQVKGGWRDHSDGNRITTTFGDKVEVIRGNYKLLVLGRQDDPTQQVAGWDISGGLISTAEQDLNYPPANPLVTPKPEFPQPKYGGQQALSTQYTWQQDSDGNWGWTMMTQTGIYAAPQPNPPAQPTNLGAGQVVQYTWVDQMSTYWGSGKPGSETDNPDPLKTSTSMEWAETIVIETHAIQKLPIAEYAEVFPSLTTTTTSDGAMTTTVTSAGVMTSTTGAMAGSLPVIVPDPTVAMLTTVTAGQVPDSVFQWPAVTPVPNDDGIPNIVNPGMNTVTASQGQLNTKLHTEADMVNETSSAGAMNIYVTSGSLPSGTVPGTPTYLPQHIYTTTPGSMNTTSAAQGTLNTLLWSGADMNNTVSASGPIYNDMSTSDAVHNLTTAVGDITDTVACVGTHVSVDTALTQFNFALSILLLELKLGFHVDIHNNHVDMHVLSHVDLHIGPHFTMDYMGSQKLDILPNFRVHADGTTNISLWNMLL